eukprot:gene6681-13536_t
MSTSDKNMCIPFAFIINRHSLVHEPALPLECVLDALTASHDMGGVAFSSRGVASALSCASQSLYEVMVTYISPLSASLSSISFSFVIYASLHCIGGAQLAFNGSKYFPLAVALLSAMTAPGLPDLCGLSTSMRFLLVFVSVSHDSSRIRLAELCGFLPVLSPAPFMIAQTHLADQSIIFSPSDYILVHQLDFHLYFHSTCSICSAGSLVYWMSLWHGLSDFHHHGHVWLSLLFELSSAGGQTDSYLLAQEQHQPFLNDLALTEANSGSFKMVLFIPVYSIAVSVSSSMFSLRLLEIVCPRKALLFRMCGGGGGVGGGGGEGSWGISGGVECCGNNVMMELWFGDFMFEAVCDWRSAPVAVDEIRIRGKSSAKIADDSRFCDFGRFLCGFEVALYESVVFEAGRDADSDYCLLTRRGRLGITKNQSINKRKYTIRQVRNDEERKTQQASSQSLFESRYHRQLLTDDNAVTYVCPSPDLATTIVNFLIRQRDRVVPRTQHHHRVVELFYLQFEYSDPSIDIKSPATSLYVGKLIYCSENISNAQRRICLTVKQVIKIMNSSFLCALFLICISLCASFTWTSFRTMHRRSAVAIKTVHMTKNSNINYETVNVSPITNDEEEEDGEEEESTEPDTTSTAPIVIDGETIMKEAAAFASSLNGSDVRVGIIMARWNEDIIKNLYKGVNESLIECGVKQSNIFTTYVPGSFELPITARFLAMSKRVDVIICMGCLIKGETMHFEFIAQAVANGVMQVSLETYVPCIFGVLTVLNTEQAIARSIGSENLGIGWGKSAVEMGLARMSALGMGKMQGKPSEPASSFVAFNTSGVVTPSDANTTEKEDKKPKKIGF